MGLDRFTIGAWGLGVLVSLSLEVLGPSGLLPGSFVLAGFVTGRVFSFGGDAPLPPRFWGELVLAVSPPVVIAILQLAAG